MCFQNAPDLILLDELFVLNPDEELHANLKVCYFFFTLCINKYV